jgi:hypothetical protein
MTSDSDLLARFAAGPALVEEAMSHAADVMSLTGPEGWSIHDVLVHLADAEIFRAVRIRLILATEGVTLPVFDQDEWRERLAYSDRDPGIAFSAYAAMVGSSADLLAASGERTWGQAGHHPEEGPITVAELVRRGANHAEEHADQIRQLSG